MSENHPIIDINPVEHSRKRIAVDDVRASYANVSSRKRDDGVGQSGTSHGFSTVAGAAGGDQARTRSPFSALGGITQVVAGAGLIALGVPMLILPGPGLFSIAAGALLIARGYSKVRRA